MATEVTQEIDRFADDVLRIKGRLIRLGSAVEVAGAKDLADEVYADLDSAWRGLLNLANLIEGRGPCNIPAEMPDFAAESD